MRKANPAFHVSSIRPAFIDAATHDAIKPYIPHPGAVKAAVYPVGASIMSKFFKPLWSPTQSLGRFMTEMAMGKWDASLNGEGVEKLGELPIVENVAYRRLAGGDAK